jgi:signal transduction histidine kinase
MASHEFRTPLSTVLSSAALIHTYAERQDFENIQKHAFKIKTAVNNLNTILTEFLSLGKLDEGKTQPNVQRMNLRQMVEDVESELKPLLKTGQTFSYEHRGEEMAFLDPGLMKHSLINLFSNAIKYSPENAPIRVETAVAGDHVSIRIHDRGMGIPEADQKHLFSRFFRATNAGNIQGTGLGLYIVKRYIELMNGEIGFESQEGKGTTFWLNFETHTPEPTTNNGTV